MMRFVNAVEAVFGRGQNHAAAHADVGEQQIVVGNDDIGVFQRVAGEVKRAFGAVGAGGFQAAVAVVGYLLPQGIVDFFAPCVAVAVELAAGKLVCHVLQSGDFFGFGLVAPQHGGLFYAV